jgi:BirA family biotin operon repressor/biotin-[acetyl-CoA-carboxylase] ligase
MFEDKNGEIFLGKISTVDENGRLVVELENETTRKFSLKEIKFASR